MPVSTLALNDGTEVSWIAFGTGTALRGRDATKIVSVAIQNGFTHLDGAQMYLNEASLGAGIVASRKPRSELYITTKLASLAPGETPKSALVKSLERLDVDYVDLYLVHQPRQHVGRLKEVWKGMEEAKAAGLTKSIGVSNFTADHLKEILEVATVLPAVNQVMHASPRRSPLIHRSWIGSSSPIYMESSRAQLCTSRKIWHRDCLLWRAIAHRPLQGWSS